MRKLSKHQGFVLFNALSFQGVWWSSVLWGNWSLLLTIPLLLLHFRLLAAIAGPQTIARDFGAMVKVGLLGVSIDTGLTLLGLFEFADVPWWLACLWLHFALSLQHSLSFVGALPRVLQALLGGIFGCLSYIAGAQFHAVALPLGNSTSALIIGILWAILLPLFFTLAPAQRLQRRQNHHPSTFTGH